MFAINSIKTANNLVHKRNPVGKLLEISILNVFDSEICNDKKCLKKKHGTNLRSMCPQYNTSINVFSLQNEDFEPGLGVNEFAFLIRISKELHFRIDASSSHDVFNYVTTHYWLQHTKYLALRRT